jgi:hypothetical protein
VDGRLIARDSMESDLVHSHHVVFDGSWVRFYMIRRSSQVLIYKLISGMKTFSQASRAKMNWKSVQRPQKKKGKLQRKLPGSRSKRGKRLKQKRFVPYLAIISSDFSMDRS